MAVYLGQLWKSNDTLWVWENVDIEKTFVIPPNEMFCVVRLHKDKNDCHNIATILTINHGRWMTTFSTITQKCDMVVQWSESFVQLKLWRWRKAQRI